MKQTALMLFFYASLIFVFVFCCLIINIKHTVAAGIQRAVTLRATLTVSHVVLFSTVYVYYLTDEGLRK